MLRTLAATFTAIAAFTLPAPALAVTAGGDLDGNLHPYVGLMVAKDASGKPIWRCSGTLIAPTVFLTAGHCTETPAATAEIWFASDVQSGVPANGYPNTGEVSGTVYLHPQYDPDAFYLHDLGVVVLNQGLIMAEYGVLPALDVLDALQPRRDTLFTSVGYGLQQVNPAFETALKIRMYANPMLLQINTGFTGDGSLLLSNNHATGGTCFGDSGGPNFVGNTRVIAGVTSFGLNGACGGTGGVYRVDRADDLGWLYSQFGTLLP